MTGVVLLHAQHHQLLLLTLLTLYGHVLLDCAATGVGTESALRFPVCDFATATPAATNTAPFTANATTFSTQVHPNRPSCMKGVQYPTPFSSHSTHPGGDRLH